jgi:hypothetical protein
MQKNSVWKARQIVESNGAYAGRTVRFMTNDGLVEAELRSAHMSDQDEDLVMIATVHGKTTRWSAVHRNSLVEVMA